MTTLRRRRPGSHKRPPRKRGQGGAPAAQRRRTTTTPPTSGPTLEPRTRRADVRDDQLTRVPGHRSCPHCGDGKSVPVPYPQGHVLDAGREDETRTECSNEDSCESAAW